MLACQCLPLATQRVELGGDPRQPFQHERDCFRQRGRAELRRERDLWHVGVGEDAFDVRGGARGHDDQDRQIAISQCVRPYRHTLLAARLDRVDKRLDGLTFADGDDRGMRRDMRHARQITEIRRQHVQQVAVPLDERALVRQPQFLARNPHCCPAYAPRPARPRGELRHGGFSRREARVSGPDG